MTEWEKRLQFHEGFKDKKYKCTAGKWTIGYGHNLEARQFTLEEKKALGDWERGITKNAAAMLLRNDMEICLEKLKTLGYWYYLDKDRQYALLDMCYQLGWDGLKGFRKMLEAIRTKDYNEAAKQCVESKYGRIDTPTRAKRIAYLIKTARWIESSSDLKDIKI